MTQSRWKSSVVWTTIVSLIVILIGNYGLWEYIGMDSEVFQKVANLILSILVMVGILNNPTNKEGF